MESNHEIAKIAYELYLMRKGAPGDPVSDWIMAERIFSERQAHLTVRTRKEATAPTAGFEAAEVFTPAEEEIPAVAVLTKPRAIRKTAAKKEVKVVAPVKESKKAVETKTSAAQVAKKPIVESKPAAGKVVRKKPQTGKASE